MPILEISDLVVRHDVTTGARLPVRRDEVIAALRAAGDRRGARIAAALREPLGRHDGVASARRAHADHDLVTAAGSASGLVPLLYRPTHHSNPFCASIRPILGVRPQDAPALRAALGPAARHLVGEARPAPRPW
ncbi:hypothetical protein [Dactylosporangium sp. CA-139066]|uniref:hypothetical protein n=1 Tax=Dactylosporangium sp. CA-139066 TaxID=3239930 RepID=UPI003D9251BD